MNRTVFIVTIFSIVVFAAGAWFPADADFARLLALCSFSMSMQMVWLTWRPAWSAATRRTDSTFGFFAIGLFFVNVGLLVQRIFGIAVRDFGMSCLLISDTFSFVVMLVLVGQSFKFAAIEANGKGIVRCKTALWAIVRALVIGAALDVLIIWLK